MSVLSWTITSYTEDDYDGVAETSKTVVPALDGVNLSHSYIRDDIETDADSKTAIKTNLTDKGYTLGKVDDLMETGSNDVLVVKANSNDGFGKSERLLPFLTDSVIKNVDLEAREITVDWDPSF